MKTFKDLVFTTHPNECSGFLTQARMDFENGYGVSVITGHAAYGSKDKPYELAVMYDKLRCYNSKITDDVLGHLTSEKVTKYMNQIQKLNK
mgnify:CR=1 FL=1|tara:strand:+ start:262 stop:534 length:273 start_codon:yes stop_codon:yes gene_type:complete